MTRAKRNKGDKQHEAGQDGIGRAKRAISAEGGKKSKNIKTIPRWAKGNFGKIGRIRYKRAKGNLKIRETSASPAVLGADAIQ